MRKLFISAIAALGMLGATVVSAGVIELTPANPQPKGVKQGLKVSYFTGDRQVRSLGAAKGRLKQSSKPGKPLKGLNYPDKGKGAPVLTAGISELVVADIRGYIKFPAPGVYDLEFFSNDGMQAWISGKQVAKLDDVTPCASAGRPKVKVPSAGWYDLKVIYFQKEGTACLESEWKKPGGSIQLIPNSAFGYK
ncbi:PA14 domain-containing protein [Shimia gijangensis]|uniref:PA14 domain-containing protein n=1 Tax=Shimia gijangensis TaxID=1470563 RepID=A0A1M6DTB7_9RHOB|nr:PA14 domain-containing protein [Shimia gijangensis]SHI76484.1 PA14 domain-containing protein [Shimia gijangensis]